MRQNEEKFIAYIEAHPGCTSVDLVAALGHETDWTRKMLRRLRDRGIARVSHWTKLRTQYLGHWELGSAPSAAKPSVGRERPKSTLRANERRFYAFVTLNPECTAQDIQRAFGHQLDWIRKMLRRLHTVQNCVRIARWSKVRAQFVAHWIAEPGPHAPRPVQTRSATVTRDMMVAFLEANPKSSVIEIAGALHVTPNYASIMLRKCRVDGRARIAAWDRDMKAYYARWSVGDAPDEPHPEPIGRRDDASPELERRVRAALGNDELSVEELAAALDMTVTSAYRAAGLCAAFLHVTQQTVIVDGVPTRRAYYRIAERRATPRQAAPVGAQSWLSALGVAA